LKGEDQDVPARICVAIRETSTAQAIVAARRAAPWADLVEMRADFIRDLDVRQLMREKPCPLIFTLRSRQEGGEYSGTERNRLETILAAAKCGADFLDVEFSAFWRAVLEAAGRERVILSHHDFQGTPDNLNKCLDEMAASGAAIIKIATQARSLADNMKICEVLRHARARGVPLCALAMGTAGMPSRVLGGTWGSWATFASLPGQPTAEGQPSAQDLLELYRIRSINASTELYGVLGRPVGHSLSPLVHNAAFAARQVNAVFLPLEAADAGDFLSFDAAFPLRGVSVTIPHKQEVFNDSASLSIEADRVGAVNTLVRRERGWHGENTDVEGFLKPLRRRMHLAHVRVLVLGAGGAARAVLYGLCSSGAVPCIVARDRAKAQQLASGFQAEHAGWEDIPSLTWDVLVNTTPVGMYPRVDESPVPPELLSRGWVYDLVYNPAETKLLRDAAARGCRTISGAEMFLAQALKQQLLWMGPPVPEQVMQQTLSRALGLAMEA
jgi:3-dehydroquinate dehydratase/shikimate dehydrogenase